MGMMNFPRMAFILVLTLFGTPSWAQTGKGFICLEALVGRADVVFTGTILRLDRTQPPKNQYPLFTLTVQVGSVLKGTPGKTVTLQRQFAADDKRWEQWTADHTPMLWLLGPDVDDDIGGRDPFTGWSTLRLGVAVPAERFFVRSRALPAFSMYLKVFRTPEEAMARIKAFLKANPKKAEYHHMAVSGDFAYQLMQSNGDWNDITLPLVPELETLAKRMIREPEALSPLREHRRIPTDLQSSATFLLSELDWLRLAGVQALVHFKSRDNIALLKPLLADPTLWGQWSANAEGNKLERFYPIRKAAYEVLSKWGVQVEKPVIVITKIGPP